MNITLSNTDAVNAIIMVEIQQADYIGEVDKMLKDLRQKTTFSGFRKGMVPVGLVKKMHGQSVLIEEINKKVSSALYGYIRENSLNILGEPLPNETEQEEINFETQVDFKFCFDIGLAPVFNVNVTKEDKLTYYTILIDNETVEKQINNYCANYGTYEKVDELTDKDLTKGLLVELHEDNSIKQGGVQLEDAVLIPFFMKNEEEKAKFSNIKKNTVITFNPYKAYDGTESELASLLKIKKEDVKLHTGNFTYEIKEITRYKNGEINQDLFDKIFEKDTVRSEEEFRTKIKEVIAEQHKPDSDYKFLLDLLQLLEEKVGGISFPDAFLKRWLVASNKDKSPESLEQDYPKIISDLKRHLIKEQVVTENHIEITDEDIQQVAKNAVRAQFAQYGMANVPENILTQHASDMLNKEDTRRNIVNKSVEDKLIEWTKKQVMLDNSEITGDEFNKFFE